MADHGSGSVDAAKRALVAWSFYLGLHTTGRSKRLTFVVFRFGTSRFCRGVSNICQSVFNLSDFLV